MRRFNVFSFGVNVCVLVCCDMTVQSCVWVRHWNTFHLFLFLLWPTFFKMSALPASQGWAQQGQRLALTRIKPMRKFEFIGPYLLATCGALWANGRIGSLLPFSKACFLANRHLSNMTIGHRRDSWRGLINYLFIWETTWITCLYLCRKAATTLDFPFCQHFQSTSFHLI